MANQLGKRYICKTCKTEVLCTQRGEGQVSCCGQKMEEQNPKPIPSGD